MQAPTEHTRHLTVDQLTAHLDRRLSGAEREAVVAHLVDCSECRHEYVDAGALVAEARTSRMNLRVAAAVAAAAVLVVLLSPHVPVSSRRQMSLDTTTRRVGSPDAAVEIHLATPVDGERISRTDVTLMWRSASPNALYRVSVQTKDGSVVWRDRTTDTVVTLPDTVALVTGETYYWIVDALGNNGRTARSPVGTFRR